MDDAGNVFSYWRKMAEENLPTMGMYLQRRPPVDIEFNDLTYTVPIDRNSSKLILRSVSGLFKSGELTAILGPSGAGKSTLLNVLAGYRRGDGTGTILVNGTHRDIRVFRKLSRYIMQEDVHQDGMTVRECLLYSAELKLGPESTKEYRSNVSDEIMELLRLTKCQNTMTSRLSGGEKKRLSIAVELVNNPPVLFLDEPTTGLDDLSSSQCVSLLKSLARGGRTVICSIHTPSAKLFALFDNVYIVAEGQCVYQGHGHDMVPFLASIGAPCPKHFNPADFMIEVSSGEYGYFIDKMVSAVDNGRCIRWNKKNDKDLITSQRKFDPEFEDIKNQPDYGCSLSTQTAILTRRMFLQFWRDIGTIIMKLLVHLMVGLVVGGMFYQMGDDASKTLFNFGFCYVSLVVFMFVPMLPALVFFPLEVKMIKREHFNRWYHLNAYFVALTFSRLFLQIGCTTIYVAASYFLSNQPMEIDRFIKFLVILFLIALSSEAMGLAISSRLDIVNGTFVGPALSVPLILLASYTFGRGSEPLPLWIKVTMYCTYSRYGIEGIVSALYGNRGNLNCPEDEIYCHFTSPSVLLSEIGIDVSTNFWITASLVGVNFLIFKLISYVVLKQRLKRARSSGIIWYVGRLIKRYFNLAR